MFIQKKRKMKKIFVIIGICMIFLLAGGVLAENLAVSENVGDFVKDVMAEKGIDKENVKSVEKVDFEDLPDELNLNNIDETNLAVYEVDYGEEKSVFVLTVSEEKFEKTLKEIANKMLLNFGHGGDVKDSLFLDTATGVQTSAEKGYVMMRQGSITGLSTNMEIFDLKEYGEVEVIIYKNAEPIGFRNTIAINESGVAKDYDVVSPDTINFEQGDVISVYVNVGDNIVAKDIITIMEINTFE